MYSALHLRPGVKPWWFEWLGRERPDLVQRYRAMYLDFARAIRSGSTPEMSLERAMADHALMEQVCGLSS